MTDKYSELRKIIADAIGVSESEISDKDIEEFLNMIKSEIYIRKFREST
ncbi:MAG: hypothetical protein QW734_07790 [Candidatus Bathyarchaeia archaeon]